MRDREGWSQQELAERVEMTQNRISLLENPFKGKPTLTTLKRLAAAFDVALVVRFVPFSQLVKWVTGTTYSEHGLSAESTNPPSFAHEDFESLAALAKLSMREDAIEDQDQERHRLGFVPHAINYPEQGRSRLLHAKGA
jgi:transcriptional regulator with XRE-family HTH domain